MLTDIAMYNCDNSGKDYLKLFKQILYKVYIDQTILVNYEHTLCNYYDISVCYFVHIIKTVIKGENIIFNVKKKWCTSLFECQ